MGVSCGPANILKKFGKGALGFQAVDVISQSDLQRSLDVRCVVARDMALRYHAHSCLLDHRTSQLRWQHFPTHHTTHREVQLHEDHPSHITITFTLQPDSALPVFKFLRLKIDTMSTHDRRDLAYPNSDLLYRGLSAEIRIKI